MTRTELDMIIDALRFRGRSLYREATSRKYYGEGFADNRRVLRLEAKKHMELAERIER